MTTHEFLDFSASVKHCSFEIALHLCILFDRLVIIYSILSIHEHGRSMSYYFSSISFFGVIKFSLYRSFITFPGFIP